MSNYLNLVISGAPITHQVLKPTEYRRYVSDTTTSTTVYGAADTASHATVYKVGYRFASDPIHGPDRRLGSRPDRGIQVQAIYGTAAVTLPPKPVAEKKAAKKAKAGKGKKAEPSSEAGPSAPAPAAAPSTPSVPDTRPAVLLEAAQYSRPEAFAQPPDSVLRVAQPFKVNEQESKSFATNVKKYFNAGGDFHLADLSALVYRLAVGMTFYSHSGSLMPHDLSGGRDANVQMIGPNYAPFANGDMTIFVPRMVDTVATPNTLCALAYAATGVGSVLASEMFAVDKDGRALIPSATDGNLALGCYEALRLIGSNYELASAGAIFAYAFTKGVHRVSSVVGMTDEGAYMRDVLREVHFRPSYGAINLQSKSWTGLPIPANLSIGAMISLVDSVALATAAGTAICDPCVERDGRMYPSTFVQQRDPDDKSKPGQHAMDDPDPTDASDEDSYDNKSELVARIAGTAPHFARNYIKFLCELFRFVHSEDAAITAQSHLELCFQQPGLRESRHLGYATVCPYYWVEPTGVIHFDTSSYTASKAGFGPLARYDAPGTLPLFENFKLLDTDTGLSEVAFSWRSARGSGAALHFKNHFLDGLANVRITQCDPDQWGNVGGPDESVEDRIENDRDIDCYMWSRGDVAYPAPGEAMYAGSAVVAVIRHRSIDPTTWRCLQTHFPDRGELTGDVTIKVSNLSPYTVGPLGPDRHARRGYSQGMLALDTARRMQGMTLKAGFGSKRFRDPAVSRQIVEARASQGEVATDTSPIATIPTPGSETVSAPLPVILETAANRAPVPAQTVRVTGAGPISANIVDEFAAAQSSSSQPVEEAPEQLAA